MTHYGVSLAFQSCPIYVGVYSKSVQSSEAGNKKNTSESLNKFFPPLGMFTWLEQGILRGLEVFIPQVRGIPVNTTGMTHKALIILFCREMRNWVFFTQLILCAGLCVICRANNIRVKTWLLCLLLLLQKIHLTNTRQRTSN